MVIFVRIRKPCTMQNYSLWAKPIGYLTILILIPLFSLLGKTVESSSGLTCPSPIITTLIPGPSSCQIQLSSPVQYASYQFRYRIRGRSTWEMQTNRWNVLHLSGLQPCTAYEFQVRQDCFNNQFSDWSTLQNISTLGCGESYCPAYASRSDGYIEKFSFGEMEYFSGNDGGWGLHLKQRFIAHVGTEMPFSITPVKTSEFYDPDPYFRVYYTIFIDFNRDNDFDDAGEYVLKDEGVTDRPYSWKIPIPKNATLGLTRMRVIMSRKTLGKACERSINILEVEDYNLGIFNPCTLRPPTNIKIDSISSGNVKLSVQGDPIGYQWRYRPKSGANWIVLDSVVTPQIRISGLVQNADYEVQVRSACGGGNWSLFSSIFSFKTPLCRIAYEEQINTYLREKNRVGLNFSLRTALNYEWRFGESLSFKWLDTLFSNSASIVIDSLKTGTKYDLQIRVECSPGNWSDWSRYTFFTWGECQAITASQLSIGLDLNFRSDDITLTSKMNTANRFFWRFRKKGTSTWYEETTNEPYYDWSAKNVPPEVTYEWQVAYQCENGQKSPWSAIGQFAMAPVYCAQTQSKLVKIKRLSAHSATLLADISYGVQFAWEWWEKGTFQLNYSGSAYAYREIELSKLKPNTEYEYRFKYWCTKGIQDWSDINSFKTLPPFPTHLGDSTRITIQHPTKLPPVVVTPNPNEGIFIVESYFDQPKNIVLTLRDLNGRIVLRRELQNQLDLRETIELKDYISGLYILEMRSEGFSKLEKIVIQQP